MSLALTRSCGADEGELVLQLKCEEEEGPMCPARRVNCLAEEEFARLCARVQRSMSDAGTV